MKNGFKKCGLLPWSATAVDYSKIRSREETNLPSQQIQPMKPADAIQEAAITGQKTPSEENISAHFNDFQVALKKINEFLGEDKLEFFISCKNSPTWPELIKQEDTTLFLMWRHFWDMSLESATNNEVMTSETQSVTPSASISKDIEINPTPSCQSLSLDVLSLTSFFDEEDPAFRILATADAVLSDESLGNILSPVLNNNPTLNNSPSENIITSISAHSKEMQKVLQNNVDLPLQQNSIDAQSSPEHLSVGAQSTPDNLSAKSPFIPQAGPSHAISEVLNGTAPVGRDVIAVKTPTCDSTPNTSSTLNISPTLKRSANDTATSSLQSTPKKAKLTFKTPTRKSPRKLLDKYSPSKRALMWPDNNQKSAIRRPSKEMLPSIISSKKWQQIVEEKEKAKQDAEDEKKRRKEEREEKKRLKLAAAEEKKKSKQKRKPSKKETQNYCIEEEDADVPDDEEAVEDEDDVLSDSGNSKKFKKEDYVIVIYEEEYFPGQITQIDETATVRTMKPAGIGIWKWPIRDDICEYEFSDIQTVIKPPVLHNKRGFYKIPEMSEYSEW